MRKTLYLPILTLFASGTLSAQQLQTSHIELQRNEKWWGYFVSESPLQPFESDFDSDAEDQTPVSVPLMVSNKGRYIWSTQPFRVQLTGSTLTLTGKSDNLTARKNGSNLREAYLYCVHKNLWSQSSGAGCNLRLPVYATGLATVSAASEQQLLQTAESLHARGVTSGTLLVADGWRDDCAGSGFDRGLYESLRTTAERIGEKGFDLMFTVTPLVPAAGRPYTDALRSHSLLLSDDSTTPLIIKTPRGWYACLDLSQAEVCDALRRTLDNALQHTDGKISFYFDLEAAADLIPDARREAFIGNWQSLADGCRAALNSLSGGTPLQWNAYSVSVGELSWERLKSMLRETLYAGIAGCIYPYWDLSSVQTCTAEELLLLRALQLAAFMPVPAVAPDDFEFQNPQYTQALRRTLECRQSMSGYLADLLAQTASTGEPTVRLMEYQFPNQGFANCDDQFMIGSEYLVAPLLDDTGRRMVRLPKGTWTAEDGTKYKGPRVVSVDASSGSIPVFRLRQASKAK